METQQVEIEEVIVIHHMKLEQAKKTFKYLRGINRMIKKRRVTALARRIKKRKIVIRPVVVAKLDFPQYKIKGWYVIDGQHLLEALIVLKLDIPFTIMDLPTMADVIDEMSGINSVSKIWTLRDYITAWSIIHDDYRILNAAVSKFKLPVHMAVYAYTMEDRHTSGDMIKDGTFVIQDRKRGDRIMEYLVELMKVIPKENLEMRRTFSQFFTRLVYEMGSRYEHSKFAEHLVNTIPTISASNSLGAEMSRVFNSFKETNLVS